MSPRPILKASGDLRLAGIHTEWTENGQTKTLILKGEGVTVHLDCPDNRTPGTLLAAYPAWTFVVASKTDG